MTHRDLYGRTKEPYPTEGWNHTLLFTQRNHTLLFTSANNWGHKTPTQSKRKRTGKKGLKGHGPEHVYNALGYIKMGQYL